METYKPNSKAMTVIEEHDALVIDMELDTIATTNPEEALEEIKEDLEDARKEHERAKRHLSGIQEKVNRLESAYNTLQEYIGEGRFAGESLSMIGAARTTLREAHGARSLDDIAEYMLEHGFVYDGDKSKLRRSLAAALSREDNIERVERGVYRMSNKLE